MPNTAKLSHDVYFALKDSSPEAAQKLVAECYAKLGTIEMHGSENLVHYRHPVNLNFLEEVAKKGYSSVRNKGDCPELHLSGISRHFSGRRIP